eukprot:TRINITY_DN7698_c0_g1_i1.p1 TRINITY_DN7698_c0_g1~~TRINITY_DN7698_c0_g1_i1.p1  ORF type:complete len:125 (+),score=17.03 TRINITY_DN7698_c0_g1_i1:32-406(+)
MCIRDSVYIYQLGSDDTSKFELKPRVNAHKGYILKVLYSPNCKLFATCGADNTVKIWNTDCYTQTQSLIGHTKWVWDCVFSAKSEYVLTGSSDTTAKLWDIASGETIKQYAVHRKAVSCVAIAE